jgi:hypothetical protein
MLLRTLAKAAVIDINGAATFDHDASRRLPNHY